MRSTVYQFVGHLLMAYINVSHGGQRRTKMARSRRLPSFQQLVGYPGQSAHHNHRLRTASVLHNANQSTNGIRIFHRRASELHHDYVVASLESALSLQSAHLRRTPFLILRNKKPTARSLLAVGSVELSLRVLYFIRSRPPEDT